MRSLSSLEAVASWMCILAFLVGAIYGSYPTLAAVAVMCVALIGVEFFLIRRKIKAQARK